MDTGRALLDFVFRWIHVVAGIMWIGNSLLFNWLDRNLRPGGSAREGSRGEIWLFHSGGFYEVEKTLVPGEVMPRPLHWFKWQAYTTWLSGATLLLLVYYLAGGALLVDPATAITPAAARIIAIGAIVGGWLGYELLWRSPAARSTAAAALISFALLLALGYGLTHSLAGRAAFLHVGALLGTIMAANVALHIMPAQRTMVGAVAKGATPDVTLSARAKLRSIHNNYMTFPVIILMMSVHFPAFYGARYSWLVLGVIVLGGAAVRHILNVRFGWPQWIPAFGATAAVTITALYLLVRRPTFGPAAVATVAGQTVSFDDAESVIHKRCTVCHSASPAIRTFGASPGGVAFDSPEQIRALTDRIRARAIDTRSMPPANQTFMTEREREILSVGLRR
jgi:uncharacterized membrane protein